MIHDGPLSDDRIMKIVGAHWYTAHYNPKRIQAMYVEDEYGDYEWVADAPNEELAKAICEQHNSTRKIMT